MAERPSNKLQRDPFAGKGGDSPAERADGGVSRREFASVEWRRANPEAVRRVVDGLVKLRDD